MSAALAARTVGRVVLTPWTVQRVPLEPDGPSARRLLLAELAKAPYQAARPSLFDRAADAVREFLTRILANGADPAARTLVVVAVVAAAVLIVLAVLVTGVPRANRRSRLASSTLFGETDERTAAELRAAAARAAAAGDHDLAVLEAFRGLARGLAERTLVDLVPGTTAAAFARDATDPLPDEADPLAAAAAVFDGVRYAGRPATRAAYDDIAALDARAVAARPALAQPPVAAGSPR